MTTVGSLLPEGMSPPAEAQGFGASGFAGPV